MTTSSLGKDHILRVAIEESTYEVAPFLLPVKEPALKLGKLLKASGCSSCAMASYDKPIVALAGAVATLILDEAKKTPNEIPVFKAHLLKTLGIPETGFKIEYVVNGKNDEFTF